MTTTYRPFLLDRGEQLLISDDALLTAQRLAAFSEATGLEPEDIVADPIVTIPVPLYRAGRRFANVNPAALWNPLFWLPAHIALRFQVRDDADTDPRPETDVEWLVRVALELQAAGLYDAEHGWVDILAIHGLDIDNPVDLARVEAWQAGGADPVLDTIDTTSLFAGDHEWAFREAEQLLPTAHPAQFALTAAAFLDALDAAPEQLPDITAIAAEMLAEETSEDVDALFAAAERLAGGAVAVAEESGVRLALENIAGRHAAALRDLTAEPRT